MGFSRANGPLFLLIFTTLIWGSTFLAIQEALVVFSPVLLVACRFSFAAVVFVWAAKAPTRTVCFGLALGALSFVCFLSQVIGLQTISSSRSAFITGLCVVFTPVVSVIWTHEKITKRVLAAIILALIGLFFLTGANLDHWGAGDWWTMLCAVGFAVYIVWLGKESSRHSLWSLTFYQLSSVALLAWLYSLFQTHQLPSFTWEDYSWVIYLGIFAGSLCVAAQTWAQRFVSPTHTALVYSLEPVFAATLAWWWKNETLGPLGTFGGVLMLTACLLAEFKIKQSQSPPPLV